MREEIVHLWSDLLRLAETQREALSGGRLEDALELQEKRQSIIDKIQKIDTNTPSSLRTNRSSVGKNDPLGEDFSQQIEVTIKTILSVDNEMCSIIKSELGFTSDKLHIIQKAKAFCHNALHHNKCGQLHIST